MWMREQRWESGSQVIVSARPYTVCGDRVRRCSEREHLQDHIRYVGTELGDAVSGEYLQDYIRYVVTVVGDAVSGEYLQDHNMICAGGGERNILLRAHPLSPAGTPHA